MRRNWQYFLFIFLMIGAIASCRKNIFPVPGEPEIGPPDPPPPPIEETQPAVLTAVKQKVTKNILGFYSALPARYDSTDQTYPLMIFFHGGGQYGNGDSAISKVLQDGVPKLLAQKTFPPSFTVNGKKFSFIIIAPQMVRFILSDEIDQLVDYAMANYRVDPARVYLVGFSLGAQMLSNYAGDHPSKIAALTVMGGTPYMDDSLEVKCQRMVSAHLPIWHFHNVDDSAWPYSEAVKFDTVLNSLHPVIKPKFTTFEVGQGKSHHDCWTRTMDPAYKEDSVNIYEWMLGYTR